MVTSPSEVCGPYEGITFEGKPIYTMGFPELSTVKERCENYRRRCQQNGKSPHEHYLKLENAVDFYIDKFTHRGIKHAYDQFSELRRTALGLGYTVPSLYGALGLDEVIFACAVLREAIAMATPLPGESQKLTGELIAAASKSISTAISAINKNYDSITRLPCP